MYSTGDVNYKKAGDTWIVEQVLNEHLSIDDGTFEEMIAHLQKEAQYYKDEYLSGPCETYCDSIVPELNTEKLGFFNKKTFIATFTSIRTEKKYNSEGERGGYFLVVGTRNAIPEEIAALEEQETKEKAEREAKQRADYERLKKVFETKQP